LKNLKLALLVSIVLSVLQVITALVVSAGIAKGIVQASSIELTLLAG
jgi:SNF family Na+-dependent transporter